MKLNRNKGLRLLAPAFMGCLVLYHVRAEPTPAMALLVLNKGDHSLAIIDPASGQIAGEVPAGDDIHEVISSADGTLAFVSNYGSGHSLSVIDLIAQKPLPPVELGALHSPHGLAQASGKIYFTAEANKIIGRYDPASRQIDWLFGLGQNRTHMIVVSKDSKRLITSNVNSDSISIIEQGSGQSSRPSGEPNGPPDGGASGGRPPGPPGRGPRDWNATNIPVGHGPEGFDLSPDGKEIWAANSHDGTVSVIDVAKKKVVQSMNVSTRASNRLKFTPDGKRVFISDLGGTDLVVLDVGTRTELKRIKLSGGAAGILMQPDGARAYVAVGSENGVTVIDLKTLEIAGHIHTGKGPDGLGWAVRN